MSNKEIKTLVAFGDSITRGYGLPDGLGWVELLSGLLKKRYGEKSIQVFNAGGNGNTSEEGLKRIESDVLSHMPGTVFVEFGGNDTVHDGRAVSVEDFERNIFKIHEKIKSKGGTVIFLTFPPVVNEWHSTRSDHYYLKWGGLDQCVEEYRRKTRDVAKSLDSPLFDLDLLLRKQIENNGREYCIAKDGVHLTAESNRLIAEAVFDFLEKNSCFTLRNNLL